MPSERTRSLIQVRDFLGGLFYEEAAYESFRSQARPLVCHYRSPTEIMLAGKPEEQGTSNKLSDCAMPEFHYRVVGHVMHFSKSRMAG
ncbi:MULTISPECIES: BPSL0761 family protein [Pseudomonas syringae group]|uniref:Uncharacterized protein n=1 Tax=Pseudomonas syringae pv. tomato TaxID=323 RepID=A0AAV1BQ54_PSEUB|nr:hypothetical protein PSPTOT1_4302 [Pseudomonas syringae pv. tomato T1]KUR43164.1 hypothetical protein PSTA9_03198 [Pseudomonas syringae pv. tomato]KUR49792.1 hypothetical protein PST407_01827 [Pseudomonas syringae pv. tomato]CAI8931307.1 hypothetical protein DAPPPG215_20585 [Pseudomonas syringae pv. tomato]